MRCPPTSLAKDGSLRATTSWHSGRRGHTCCSGAAVCWMATPRGWAIARGLRGGASSWDGRWVSAAQRASAGRCASKFAQVTHSTGRSRTSTAAPKRL
eukprot:6648645-Prymnesium_polylepis.1